MELVVINDFSGGVNNTTPPDNMKDNEVRVMENAHPALRGGFERRTGNAALNDTSYHAIADVNVDQLIEWPFDDGSTQVFAMVNNKLCLVNQTTGVLTEKLTLNAATIGFAIHRETMFFVDQLKYYVYGYYKYTTESGTQDIAVGDVVKNDPLSTHLTLKGTLGHYYKAKGIMAAEDLAASAYGDTSKWDDVTIGTMCDNCIEVIPKAGATNDLTPIKRCKYLAFHPLSGRLFAAGDYKYPTRLYFSTMLDPTEFIETDYATPTTANGPITGLVAFNQSMMVAYKNTWRVLRGTLVDANNRTWHYLNIPYGCVSNDTIVLTPESLTFQGQDGHIYIMSPSLLADEANMVNVGQSLVYPITEERLTVTVNTMVNLSGNKACWYKGKYLLAYCDSTTPGAKNNKVLELTWATKAFSFVTGWQVNCWCSRIDSTLLFGSLNYILQGYTGYNDVDTATGLEKAVAFKVQTKPYSLKTYFNKMLDFLTITANQYITSTDIGAINIEVSSDYNLKDIDSDLFVTTDLNSDLNESLVWGRTWGKIWGFSEIINQWAVMSRTGYRFQVTLTDSTVDNPIFIYGLGFMFTILKDFNKDPIYQAPLIAHSV